MKCKFEEFVLDVVSHTFSFFHMVVFQAIVESKPIEHTKYYSKIEDIARRTNLHQRDIMRYVVELQNNNFIECTHINDPETKKRIMVCGLHMEKTLNHILCKLTRIQSELQKAADGQLYCTDCSKFLNITDVICHEIPDFKDSTSIDEDAFRPKCPVDANHELVKKYDSSEAEDVVRSLLERLHVLKDEEPMYKYSCHLNLSSTGDALVTL